MNPWQIIGWIVLSMIALAALNAASKPVLRHLAHLITRGTKRQQGQKWAQGGSILYIGQEVKEGTFVIKCGSSSWWENEEDWKKRVRNRKLFLLPG